MNNEPVLPAHLLTDLLRDGIRVKLLSWELTEQHTYLAKYRLSKTEDGIASWLVILNIEFSRFYYEAVPVKYIVWQLLQEYLEPHLAKVWIEFKATQQELDWLNKHQHEHVEVEYPYELPVQQSNEVFWVQGEWGYSILIAPTSFGHLVVSLLTEPVKDDTVQ